MKDAFEKTVIRPDGGQCTPPAPAKPPVLTLDVSLYDSYLADSGMTDDQQREFLEALWSIVVSFVDLGFGIHPVQQVLDAAAWEKIAEKSATDGSGLLLSKEKPQNRNGEKA